jgi:hypothetical protein
MRYGDTGGCEILFSWLLKLAYVWKYFGLCCRHTLQSKCLLLYTSPLVSLSVCYQPTFQNEKRARAAVDTALRFLPRPYVSSKVWSRDLTARVVASGAVSSSRWETESVGSTGNACDLYSVGGRFESRLGHQISWVLLGKWSYSTLSQATSVSIHFHATAQCSTVWVTDNIIKQLQNKIIVLKLFLWYIWPSKPVLIMCITCFNINVCVR